MLKLPQERFVDGARSHGVGTIQGDAPATNKAYKKLISALRELRETPDHGVSFLLGLLKDDDPSVVTWAALHLLPSKQDEATFALRNVASTATPLIAFGAEMTLKEWQSGRLVIE